MEKGDLENKHGDILDTAKLCTVAYVYIFLWSFHIEYSSKPKHSGSDTVGLPNMTAEQHRNQHVDHKMKILGFADLMSAQSGKSDFVNFSGFSLYENDLLVTFSSNVLPEGISLTVICPKLIYV